MKREFTYTDFDREIWDKEFEDFVPQKIYDMHTHLWTESGQEKMPENNSPLRYDAPFAKLKEWSCKIFPNRECHFFCLGSPIENMDVEKHNQWLSEEMKNDPESISAMIVTPQTNDNHLVHGFSELNFDGVKPYRVFAPDPKSARISDYLPEAQLEIINQYKKAVMLHLSMPDGADNPKNLADLKLYTKKYPDIKWVLAHCARAFNSMFIEKAIHTLKDIPNIWYDTSAVNDLYTHVLLLRHENIKRIMFGSDNIVAGSVRGKYITRARSWEFYDKEKNLDYCDSRLTLVIYEQLLQQKRAFDILELNKTDINRVFCENAANFIKLLRDH